LLTIEVYRAALYIIVMIQTFRCKHTAAIFAGKESRKWPAAFQLLALRKLAMLDTAFNINDLRIPPGNRLEKLSGNRSDQWSVRINNQWRLCFRFENGCAYDVEIADYH
jgi:toxin HigB-1